METTYFSIFYDTQWSCLLTIGLWKQSILAFLTTRTEVANWKCPSDHDTHTDSSWCLQSQWNFKPKQKKMLTWRQNLGAEDQLGTPTPLWFLHWMAALQILQRDVKASYKLFFFSSFSFFFSLTIWIITTSHCLNTYLLKTFYTVDSHLQPSYYYSLMSTRSLKAGMWLITQNLANWCRDAEICGD